MTAYIAKTIQNKVALSQNPVQIWPLFNLFPDPKGQKDPFRTQKGPQKEGQKMNTYIAKSGQNV